MKDVNTWPTEYVEHRGKQYVVQEPDSEQLMSIIQEHEGGSILLQRLVAICVFVNGVPYGDGPVPASLYRKLADKLTLLTELEVDKGNG